MTLVVVACGSAFLVLAGATGAAATSLDGLPRRGDYTLKRVDVDVRGVVSASAVREVMLTKRPAWWKPWKRWTSETPFNRDVFATDLERVRALLRRTGHYGAELDYDLQLDGDAVTVVLRVDAGPAVAVESVELTAADFALPEDERATLRALVPLAPGAPFDEDAYATGATRLAAYYQNRGYAYANVARHAVVDTATDRVDVDYTITRGRPAVFGATRITGTEKRPEHLVRRELTYEPGDAWDPRVLAKTQAEVFGLGLFRSVTVEPTNLAAETGVVDVAIVVVEGPARELQAGIGYGLEDGPRGLLRWQSYDFLGGGRQLGFRLKASLIEQSFESEFRQPFFLAPTQTLIVPLAQTREDEPAFTLQRIRLAPRVERTIGTTMRVALGLNVEYDDLSDVPRATVQRLDAYDARGVLASVTALFERSTVATDLLDPHDGSVVTLQAEQAGGPWQGDFSFYRATAEAKRYWPVFGTRVIAARIRGGVADAFGSSGDVPLFRRFFAGGINSIRGYDRWMLGPLSERDDPVGGRTLVEAGVEFRTPIWGDLGGVVFLDAGEVRRQAFRFSVADLQLGAGIGIRYATIVGPLRLDFGVPFPEAPRGEPGWQIHFSIGQAF